MKVITLRTEKRVQLVNITEKIQSLIRREKWEKGAILLFVPHTTAGITINEGADPDVCRDIEHVLSTLIPHRGPYRHMEGNADAHIKTVMTGNSNLVILEEESLKLGTWQSIFFCEYDGPRTRQVWVRYLPA